MRNRFERSADIPPASEIVKQIRILHDTFGHVVANAADRDFDFARTIGVHRVRNDQVTSIASTDFTAFINHYIGGDVTGIAGAYGSELQYRREKGDQFDALSLEHGMRTAQQIGDKMIDEWRMTDPYHPMSGLEAESIVLLDSAIHWFDWSQKLDAFFAVRRVVSELGNEYAMLNHGVRLIGH